MKRQRHHLTGPFGFTVTLIALMAASLFVAAMIQQPPAQAYSQADAGAELYQTNCAACHQAGGEGIVGTFPPLAANPAAADPTYVAAVIADGLSGPLEVLGQSYDSAMPPVTTLSGADIDLVTAFVVEMAGGAAAEPEPAAPVEPPSAGDIDRGHDLFIGSNRLDNGGGACAACHTAGSVGNLGGNSLGPDLTNVFATFGGETGLSAWLTNPPSQTMQPIFVDHPITDAEIADLVAFLADAPNQDEPPDAVDIMLLVSLGGFLILLGGMAIAWRGMRQTYVDKLRTKR